MKKYLQRIYVTVFSLATCSSFILKEVNQDKLKSETYPKPTNGTIIRDEKENEENFNERREKWFENMHRAAPNVNWHEVEHDNMMRSYNAQMAFRNGGQNTINDSYAGGSLQGTWAERGSNNQAGRVTATAYFKSKNKLYVLGDGGKLFRGVPDSAAWKLLNDNLRFRNNVLCVLPKTAGIARVLVANDLNVNYTDDDGVTFNASTGISFPISWGGNYIAQIVYLEDSAKTVYCLTRPWDDTPWGPKFWLYRSNNKGQSFTKIYEFDEHDDNRLSLWVAYAGTTDLYALGNQDDVNFKAKLYKITGTSVTVLSSSSTLPHNITTRFKGYQSGTTVTLYAQTDYSIYRTTNFGVSWTFQGFAPISNGAFGISVKSSSKIFCGGVNCYYSTNSGISFNTVNNWTDYYGNEATKLHADMMSIDFFKRKDGSEFGIVNCDGGTYRSDDYLVTNTNIGLKGLNVGEFYDVISDPANSNWFYGGSQDQGFQRISNGGGVGKKDFTQVISGDYGKMQLTGTNNNHLWMEYPGGEMYYYNDAHTGFSSIYSLSGSAKPLFGWMLATARVYPVNNNKIYIGGGNVNGGSGSYIAKLTAQTVSPYSITGTNINYDFRANSNDGNSGISAIATTPFNANKIYVATEDGTFFYSSNAGTSWNKTASFNGPYPFYDFGNAIYASKLTANLVYFGGSGYSNPPVYKSVDGGATFTAASNGLPNCLIFDLDANADESLLFAATSAGPYVYLVAANTWYSMLGTNAPYQDYYSVEFYAPTNTVRWATYGRGVWDFTITAQPIVSQNAFANDTSSINLSNSAIWINPNPVVGGQLHLTCNYSKIIDFSLYDMNGKLVLNRKVNSNSTFDLRTLEAGLYIYKIMGNQEETGKLLVK